MLLKLQNVSKVYRPETSPVYALKNVNLEIKQGEYIAIVGPSGSGKSTLMHLIGCLDVPTSGKVFLENKNISQLNESELAIIRNQKIGFVFQTFNLIPRTSALENVILPMVYAKKAGNIKQKATQVLKTLGLGERLTHHPNQLSGGEQQRIAIARALVNQPKIILADEPTGNLDTKTGESIVNIFKKLNQHGHTVILVTHDPDLAKKTKRIIKIKDGEIQ